jgi:hypothetical protein
MTMFAKTVLLALLVVPGAAAAESEPTGKTTQSGATRPAVHADAGVTAGSVRCRMYFGCTRTNRAASDTTHTLSEQ